MDLSQVSHRKFSVDSVVEYLQDVFQFARGIPIPRQAVVDGAVDLGDRFWLLYFGSVYLLYRQKCGHVLIYRS